MKFKPDLKVILATFLMALVMLPVMAQERQVTGTVYEPDGVTPVFGATVVLKGTTTGTSTDARGAYSIRVAGASPVLEIQFLGYIKQELAVGDRNVINVVLQEEAIEVSAVVVTALGLTREEKSLGYAVSKVASEEITQVVTNNWLSGMSGKVAGLTFNSASSGPISSMRVTLRGDASLSYGANEALFVVDGVPIRSGTTATSSSSSYTNSGSDFPVDFGNGASDLNPEDIESVSVLKGPAATALYGSRAANGAIVITTKSGRKTKGIGVTLNSSVVVERPGYWPDFQTQFGSGSDMGLNEYNFWTLDPSLVGTTDYPPRNLSRYAWGEEFSEDKLRYQYAGKNWETGEIVKTPFVYQDDWFTGIFQDGITYNNSVDISGSNGEGQNIRFSMTDTRNKWILPNTGFQKQSYALSFESPVNKWIDFKTKVNYYRTDSDNMPMAGYHQTTVMYDLMWGYNSNSMADWRNEYFKGRFNAINRAATISEGGNSLVFAGTGSYNPYRVLYEELNTTDKDRVFGNLGLTIKIARGLTLDLRTGMDFSNEFRTQRKPKMTFGWENGFYREQGFMTFEANSDFLLKYERSFLDSRLTTTTAFGGNNMSSHYRSNTVQLDELDIEGVYHIDNVPFGIYQRPSSFRNYKMINSLYGFMTLGWDDTYYLDITGRNDWTSTLAPKNWSYFYPSVALSVLVDQMFDFRTTLPAVSMAKLRLSWANVGNDTSPYGLDQYYSASSISGGYTLPSLIPDPMIEPENMESWELGLDTKFFKNRLGLDIALYRSSTTNQIISLDIDPIVGASSMRINVGEITNKGIEVSMYATPVKTSDFTWNLNFNWAANRNTLVSLHESLDPSQPYKHDMGTTIGGRLHLYSYVGQEMYQLYGFALKRAPEGSFYTDNNGERVDCSGQVLIDATTGLPSVESTADHFLGKVNPDWKGGFGTSLRYRNLSLSALFSYQMGGHRFSVTHGILSYQGKLTNSLEGRYDGIVAEGVNMTGTGEAATFQPNNTVTNSIYTYYQAITLDRYNGEAHTFETSFLKWKEVRLEYALPSVFIQKTRVLQGASVAIFATNLFSWDKWPQFDPEGGMLTGTNVFNGIEAGAYPMTRTVGANLRLSF